LNAPLIFYEDEAQIVGMDFTPINGGASVCVKDRYHHVEYEREARFLPVQEARKLWKSLLDSGKWERVR